MNYILSASILSFFLQNYIAFLKFRKILNPIFLFSIIHFFHNWSFSFSKYFSDLLIWNAFPSVSYLTMHELLRANLIGSWAFFLIILFFAKTKKFAFKHSISNTKFLKNIYFIFSFFYLLRTILLFDPSTNYGSNQALISSDAYNPIQTLFFLRVTAIMIYVALNKINKKTLSKILLIELSISLITFDRKDFLFIVGTILLKQINTTNFNISVLRKYFAYLLTLACFVIFIPQFRVARGQSTLENIIITLNNLKDFSEQIFFYGINLANSEGVQNWTYQLIQNGDLTILWGKSYFQAIINMVILRPFQGNIADYQAAYYFKSAAYPDISSTGFDYTFTAEAILNFGINFSFISFAILGLFVAYFYSNRFKSDLIYANYHIMWPLLLISFRTDSTALFRFYSYIILIILYCIITKKFKKIYY